ncbi:MAG: hypothetical protein MI861_28105, partial [Pirellulales bacterium]|nr:hypothetical protein [Pirellulales bacterium]
MPAKNTAAEETSAPTETGSVEQTLLLPATAGASPTGVSKQEQDLAFAVVLTQSGKITLRQLARAVKEWTIYGRQRLVDRLLEVKLISVTESNARTAEADQLLQEAENATSGAAKNLDQSQLAMARIAFLDSGGRVAKALGLNNAGAVVAADAGR